MADLFRVAAEQRAAILAREREVSAELVRIYGQTYQAIRAQVAVLQAQIDAAHAAGETITIAWLYQRQRLQSLQVQVETELLRFADSAETLITSEQRSQIALAREHVGVQIAAGSPLRGPGIALSFARLPTGPVEELVGVLANGSPLRALLAELGPEGAKTVADGLLQGVALGKSTGQIARDIRVGLGGNLARAQTIATTEVIRSYRGSSRQTALANKDVLQDWIWQASFSRRTCASCIALSGSVHPVSEPMHEHPRGRCVAIYRVRGSQQPLPESGPSWFARQDEETQLAMLGSSKFRAYRDGAIDLSDLVATSHSHQWGTTFHEKSLLAAVGEEQARRYIKAGSVALSAS